MRYEPFPVLSLSDFHMNGSLVELDTWRLFSVDLMTQYSRIKTSRAADFSPVHVLYV